MSSLDTESKIKTVNPNEEILISMRLQFSGNAKRSGVYQIRNERNGKVYIGSTVRFATRASQHLSRLRREKHGNKHLLSAWKKYGEASFVFEILELVDDKVLRRRREQEIIDSYLPNWDMCYNLDKHVKTEQRTWSKNPEITRRKKSVNAKKLWKTRWFRERMSGRRSPSYGRVLSEEAKRSISEKAKGNKRTLGYHHSEAAKAKISKTHKGRKRTVEQKEAHRAKLRGRKLTPEHRKKISLGNIGRKQSEYQKCRISEANSKTYACKLQSPTGEIYGPITNVMEFCRKHNLQAQKMYLVLAGKRRAHKGWKIHEK